jgi:hypothetical protein
MTLRGSGGDEKRHRILYLNLADLCGDVLRVSGTLAWEVGRSEPAHGKARALPWAVRLGVVPSYGTLTVTPSPLAEMWKVPAAALAA